MSTAPDWVTLTADEEVVWRGRPSPIPHVVGLTGPLVFVALGVALWLVVEGQVDLGIDLPSVIPTAAIAGAIPTTLIAALLVAWGLFGAVTDLLAWWSTRYLLTSEEVYKKQGVVSRTVTNLRLEQIQNTTFDQSVIGRLLSYGDVRVATAGTAGTEMVFENAPDPGGVVESITRRLDRQ